jgi:DNA (cytosine-5)-methyltransferase 1
MKHASLFSGIGGFDLAAQWMGWENVFQVEIDSFCQRVLEKNFPKTKRYGDIKQFDGTKYRGAIDVLTGGFPCQPFSVAGRRKGKDDDRYLWPKMLKVIMESEPTFIVGENVGGSWELVDEICTDLANIGYEAEPIGIETASIGADHKRERFWFMAYSNRIGLQGCFERMQENKKQRVIHAPILPPLSFQRERSKDYIPKPFVVGGRDGIPDRAHRTKALGNAIVPQVAFEIFKAIESTLFGQIADFKPG